MANAYDLVRYPNWPVQETHPVTLGAFAAFCESVGARPGGARRNFSCFAAPQAGKDGRRGGPCLRHPHGRDRVALATEMAKRTGVAEEAAGVRMPAALAEMARPGLMMA